MAAPDLKDRNTVPNQQQEVESDTRIKQWEYVRLSIEALFNHNIPEEYKEPLLEWASIRVLQKFGGIDSDSYERRKKEFQSRYGELWDNEGFIDGISKITSLTNTGAPVPKKYIK